MNLQIVHNGNKYFEYNLNTKIVVYKLMFKNKNNR